MLMQPGDYVLVVDSSDELRLALKNILKQAGFSKVDAVTTLNEAKSVLATTDVDWIISEAPRVDATVLENFFLTLNKQKKFPLLSLLVDNSIENQTLRWFYSQGGLSHHLRETDDGALMAEFQLLLERAFGDEVEPAEVSAYYLRLLLNNPSERLEFEENLTRAFPQNANLQMWLAEALFKNGRFDEAFACLPQTDATTLEKTPALQQLCNQITEAGTERESQNQKRISDVFVVDSDTTTHSIIKEALEPMGMVKIDCFVNPIDAWNEILRAGKPPSLVVMEWKLAQLSAPLFIGRFQAEGFFETRFLVVSSVLRESDKTVISELGISHLVAKPLELNSLQSIFAKVFRQTRNPAEQKFLEQKIIRLLRNGKVAEAEKLRDAYSNLTGPSKHARLYIDAEFLFAKDELVKAKETVICALKSGGREGLSSMHLLGKCLMKLGDYDAALIFFKKAQELSAADPERLCMIAEDFLSTGDIDAATEAINKANSIDDANTTVAVTRACLLTMQNKNTEATALLAQVSGVAIEVVSFLNNQAVSRIKKKEMTEGIALYLQTLKTVRESFPKFTASVLYNLALAYIKAARLGDALSTLKDAKASMPEAPLAKKINSLMGRVDEGMRLCMETIDLVARPTPAPIAKPAANNDDFLEFESISSEPQTSQKAEPEIDESLMQLIREPILGPGLKGIYFI